MRQAYLVEQEACPGQSPAAPAAGAGAAAAAAEVEALEQLQQVVARRRGGRHRQHPAAGGTYRFQPSATRACRVAVQRPCMEMEIWNGWAGVLNNNN